MSRAWAHAWPALVLAPGALQAHALHHGACVLATTWWYAVAMLMQLSALGLEFSLYPGGPQRILLEDESAHNNCKAAF